VAFWLVAAAFLVVMAFNTVPTPLWPLYQQENGISTVSITLAFSAYALGVLISLFLGGHISDWRGRRRVLFPALVLEIIAAVLFLSSTALPAILVARLLGGLGVGLITATATAFCIELHAHFRPGRPAHLADGVTTTANLGGLGAGPVVSGVLAATVPRPLTTVYVVFLVLLVLAVVAVALAPETVQRHDRSYRPQRVVVPPSARARYLVLGLAGFLAFTLFGLFTSLAPKILGSTLGVSSPAITGLVTALVFAFAVVAQLLLGRAAPEHQLTWGLWSLAAGFVLLLISGMTGNLVIFLLGAAVGGVGAGLVFKGVMISARFLAAPQARGEALAGMFLASYLGMMIPAIGLAAAADTWSLEAGLSGLSTVVLVLIAVTGASLARTARNR
jgi:predicted MFS family arabinose efflux permease